MVYKNKQTKQNKTQTEQKTKIYKQSYKHAFTATATKNKQKRYKKKEEGTTTAVMTTYKKGEKKCDLIF